MSGGASSDQEGRPHDCLMVCEHFGAELARLRGEGWRVDEIYPADEPQSAILSRGEKSVRLTSQRAANEPGESLPAFRPAFVLTRASDGGGEGRAGMLYRDLIPDRLGGRYIASHITIPEGGPVDDWVHYHGIAFQMIYVRSGWVKVVYEDQGDSFVMNAGDLVLQPPFIRHRVLESSPCLEVIEIGCPALHKTFGDHEMELPNGVNADRLFSGQQFLRHIAADTPWTPFGSGEAQETAMESVTAGLADVRTASAIDGAPIEFEPHHGELVFAFVLSGSARISFEGEQALGAGDSFVIPPGKAWTIDAASPDFRLLHVATAQIPDAPAKTA